MANFDAVIVLGKNLGYWGSRKKIQNSLNHLSRKSELNVLATGLFYKNNNVNKIIFSGGKTVGTHYPSEAEAMKKFLNEKFPDIPQNSIILEENSLDTKQNTEEAKKILNELNLSNIGFITTSAHIPRSQMLFKRLSLNPSPFASENIVKQFDPATFEEYKNELGKSEVITEKIISVSQRIPIYSSLLNSFIEKRRSLN